MRITHVYETISEANTRQPTKEEHIALLERKKRSLLHEMKILSMKMHDWIQAGVVSQMGDKDKHQDAIVIPDSETRHILSKDPHTQQLVLKTFARFTIAREILTNSVMIELDTLQKEGESTKTGNTAS